MMNHSNSNSNTKDTILFIDDEVEILNSIKRVFRKSPFHILLASSGEHGLKLLHENDVNVIVSDMQMQTMNGVDLLKKAKIINEDATRIVLSGHSKMNDIMDSINLGNIWCFIAKPFSAENLLQTIQNANQFYKDQLQKKELLLELKQKNDKLNELNSSLEQIVCKRTWELKVRAEALEMIVEADETNRILEKISEDIKELTRAVNVRIFTEENQCKIGHIIEIYKTGKTIGYLSIEKPEIPLDSVNKELEGFKPIIAIILSIKQTELNAPSMIQNIDRVLEQF